MDKQESGSDKTKAQDQCPPSDKGTGATASSDIKKIHAKKTCQTTKSKKKRWPRPRPDWIAAISTFLLVIITAIYTNSACNQTELIRKNFVLDTNTTNLEQRPWLGYYGYTIQAREDSTATWKNRKPKAGERMRVRCSIQNAGKTPALNIQLMLIFPEIIPTGMALEEPDKWIPSADKFLLFPGAEGFGHIGEEIVLTTQQFSEYSTSQKHLFFWAKLYYCDLAGQRHWTQAGVTHRLDSNEFQIFSSTVGTISGETPHPGCQN